MSQSDYLNAKRKLVLYNSLSSRSTNNTSFDKSTSDSTSFDGNRYFSTREGVNAANQVKRYETCALNTNADIFNNNKICNVKITNGTDTVYALQTY